MSARILVSDVTAEVAEWVGCSVEQLLGRDRSLVWARQLSMVIAMRLSPRSQASIARAFGRDPTCLRHALRRVDALMAGDAAFATVLTELERAITERASNRSGDARTLFRAFAAEHAIGRVGS